MKHIFWAHSPIGYEVFRSFRDHNLADENNSLLITARNFYPPDADCTLGLPEEYVWMNENQFTEASKKIIDLINLTEGEDYILYIPQTANFFIRCLIESPRCMGFHIFDEGTAARDPAFSSSLSFRGFYKYNLRDDAIILYFLDFLKINFDRIYEIYSLGVPFYELDHTKFSGFLSHFNEAFPKRDASKLVRSKVIGVNKCSQYALLLMPSFHELIKHEDFNSRLQNLVNSVNTIRMLDKSMKLVIKFHPHDSDEVALKVSKLFNAILFNEFCDKNKISKFREPAFMGFKFYISYPNSTIEFMKEVGGNYIAF
jgi:hypothetical protein